jgi:hypothetical protein
MGLPVPFYFDLLGSLLNHFVRGYFDSDGSAYFKKTKNGIQLPKISFLGTESFLLTLKEKILCLGYTSANANKLLIAISMVVGERFSPFPADK